jgi:hypothetical protein
MPNNGNNWLLYLDKTCNGRLKLFRHDLDLSLGFPEAIGLPQREFTTTNVYEYGHESPLAVILQIPEYRALYTTYWKKLLAAYLHTDGLLVARAALIHDTAALSVVQDQWHQQCLALTTTDFERGATASIGNITGMIPWLQKRIATAQQQLDK